MHSEDGTRISRVDQPMRAFDRGFYANLTAMYDYLGIRYHPERFFFSFSRLPKHGSTEDGIETAESKPYFIHSSNNHRIPPVRPEACGFWPWVSETVYLAFCLVWFTVCCFFIPPRESRSVNGKARHCESLGQYCRRTWIPTYFVESYLMPGLASISTCTHAEMLNFPAKDVIDYKRRSLNSPHLRVSGGVSNVQKKLAQGLVVRFNCRVTSVTRMTSGAVCISWEPSVEKTPTTTSTTTSSPDTSPNQVQSKIFDHVILAVPPNAVGSIFAPLKHEMTHIPTAAVESIIHTDLSATNDLSSNARYRMDCDHDAYSSINPSNPSSGSNSPPNWIHFRSSPDLTESIHEDPESAVIVTNFPTTPIDPTKIIARTYFTRTLRTPRSRGVVNRIFGDKRVVRSGEDAPLLGKTDGEMFWNGDGNVWLVGSWCWDGMVLLEGCVVSATRVARELGVEVPW